MDTNMQGIVIKSTGSWYTVEAVSGELYRCRIRGRLRLKGVRTTNPVTVGDKIRFEYEGAPETMQGVITAIEPRKNYIIRKSTNLSKETHIIAANIDNAFLVATLDFPPTNNEFIDRFLVTCEVYKIPATILLNKTDLFPKDLFGEIIDDFHHTYNNAGYKVIDVSAKDGTGINEVKEMLNGKISLFSGNSGVGKSSLIKAIAPELSIRIGNISDYHHKGKHTTTFSEMFKIADNSYLIDTQGIKGFGLVDLEKGEIARYFPDLFAYVPQCRFYNCTHTHEPHCAVKEAVEKGLIPPERYDSYLKMLEDNNEKYRK